MQEWLVLLTGSILRRKVVMVRASTREEAKKLAEEGKGEYVDGEFRPVERGEMKAIKIEPKLR